MKICILKSKKYIAITKFIIHKILDEKKIADQKIDNILICINELLANIIGHTTSKYKDGTVSLLLNIGGDRIIFDIMTEDEKIDISNEFKDSAFRKNYSGAGLYIIKNYADEFYYEHKANKNFFKLIFSLL
ncbi:MAG TPA: ATP-binding protein [bacterium]|nr:ATP-binding protein [bacterium]HPP87702.1 ATP-binding protein [bacterium]